MFTFEEPSGWGWLYVLSEWVIRVVMMVIVPFRRSPEAAKGWLLCIFFFPWAGLLLYLIIGRPRLPRWRMERQARLPQAFKPLIERLSKSPNISAPKIDPELRQAVVLVHNLSGSYSLGGNSVELLPDYGPSIDRLLADIDAAQQHVHLLFYIIADDATGQRVVAALERAVKRGVVCRVLLDALGSRPWVHGIVPMLQNAGVQVHEMLPVGLLKRKSGRVDLRNHRKIAVLDGRTAYAGSQNLVDATFKKGLTFEDLMARVTGPVVLELQAVFVWDWFLESDELLYDDKIFPEPTATGTVTVQPLPSGPGYPTENMQRLTVALVHGARKRVVITSPYFVPDMALLQAMQTAVLRGVRVDLIVCRQADQLLVSLAQKSYYTELLESGVHIHRYEAAFLHAKHMTIDDEIAVVGSSNMDIRSFALNNEITLLFYDDAITLELRKIQDRYLARCQTLDLEEWKKRPLRRQVLENLARLMSPLL